MSAPGEMLGRYRLDAVLGRGGMAEVFRAVDTKLGRPVAVKVIHSEHLAEPSFVERFLREARLVASLEHPNILPVYDFGEDGGRPFLVLPLLGGGTLRDRIAEGPVPIGKAAVWIGQLAGALDAAHEAGVLHRDVKPANVLLGKEERLFLADFGIAKMLEGASGLTATGIVMGTPLYMAPEQAQGKAATPATDRYALAVVAYEMLAGHPPFQGESPLALMHQHVTAPAPALSTRSRGLPAGLDAVFARALAKEPAERHATSSEFAAAVAAFAPTGPTARKAPTPVSQSAPTVISTARLRSVTTPPPGLTSEETLRATKEGGPKKKSRVGVVVATLAGVVALGGLALLLRGIERETAGREGVPAPAPSAAPAVPEATPSPFPLSRKSPAVSPLVSPVLPPTPAPAPPQTPLAANVPAAGGAAAPLRTAFERVDPAKRSGGRVSNEDFEFALDAARRALKKNPESPAARFLEIHAEGGLAYVAGRDGEASRAVVEAFEYSKRTTQRDLGHLGFLVRGPGGAIVPPKGWELALAYGDARGEAEGLLDEELARRPNEPKALLGRAYLRRIQGRTSEAIADLRRAVAANPAPVVRQGVLEMFRNACRSGLAEACAEAERMAESPPPARPRRRLGAGQ